MRRAEQNNASSSQRATFDTKIGREPLTDFNFDHFEDDPETAAMLLHCNNGTHQWRATRSLGDNPTKTDSLTALKERIRGQMITPELQKDLGAKFLAAQGRGCPWGSKREFVPGASRDAPIYACGSCGFRSQALIDTNALSYAEMDINDLSLLKLDDNALAEHRERMDDPAFTIHLPIDDQGSVEKADVWRVYSVWPPEKGRDTYYHLHPEFVVIGKKHETVMICSICSNSIAGGEVPPLSLKAGIDFGWYRRVPQLQPLSLLERHVVSKVRHYAQVVKIESNVKKRREHSRCSLRGCCIVFPHESPRVASNLLSLETIVENFCIHFVGPSGEFDSLYKRTYDVNPNHVFGRSYVIYQWMQVLRVTNPRCYGNEPPLPSLDEFTGVLKSATRNLMETSFRTFDDDAVRNSEIARDDIAGIRASSNPHHETLQNDSDVEDDDLQQDGILEPREMPLRYALVTSTEQTAHNSHTDSIHDFLSGAAETIGMDVSEQRRNYHQSQAKRFADPINEFTNGDYALVASFPDIFLLGRAYGSNSALTEKQRLHVLLQFTNAAASNQHFIFSEFDKQQRFSTVRSMHAKVKRDPRAFESFVNKFMSPDFQVKLKAAVENPAGRNARQVLRHLAPVLKAGGKKAVFGALERHAAAGEILAMGRRFAAAPNFLTMAVDDVNNPTVFRLSKYSTNNVDWPALAPGEVFEKLEEGSTYEGAGTVKIDCSRPALAAAATESPVAVALAYKKIVFDVMTILVGIQPANTSGDNNRMLKTVYKDWSKKGVVVGTALGFIGVTETTARGSLHFHVGKSAMLGLLVIWGGLCPELLESISTVPELCEEASKVLESMYSAELPKHLHVRDLVEKEMSVYYSRSNLSESRGWRKRKRTTGRAILVPPDPVERQAQFRNHCHQTILFCNIHVHQMTCRKGQKGYTGCRLAMPKGKKQRTGPVQLVDTTPDDVEHPTISYKVDEVQTKSDACAQGGGRSTNLHPFDPIDPRIIVWEVKRPLFDEALPAPPIDLGSQNALKEWLILHLREGMTAIPSPAANPPQMLLADETIVDELISHLQGMSTEDLGTLYDRVSKTVEERNGYVADFNVLLSAIMGCNTNSLFLGSREQSTAAVFYIGPYMCKNLVEIIDSFDLLLEAQDYASRYPSSADDSATNKRMVQFTLTRVLNKMNSLVEVSSDQAAAGLLGMDAGMCSEIFWGYDGNSHVQYMHDDKFGGAGDGRSGGADSVISSDGSHSAGSLDDFIEDDGTIDENGFVNGDGDSDADWGTGNDGATTNSEASFQAGPPPSDIQFETPDLSCPFETSYNAGSPYGSCPVFQIESGTALAPVPYPAMYRYRGVYLRNLSRYEYCCLVRVKKNSEKEGAEVYRNRGRRRSRRFEFADGIPIRFSHHQVLRSKQCTLKLFQNPPPHPGPRPGETASPSELDAWTRRAVKFATYYLVLFRPEEELYCAGQVNKLNYDWEAFEDFCNKLKDSTREIDRLRFEIMERYVHGWRTNARRRHILSAYRNRDRTLWSKEQQEEAKEAFGDRSSSNKSKFDGEGLFEECATEQCYQQLAPHEERQIMSQVAFSDDLVRTLDSAVGSLLHSAEDAPPDGAPDGMRVVTAPALLGLAASLAEVTPTGDSDDDDDDIDGGPDGAGATEEEIFRRVDSFVAEQNLSQDKAVAVDLMNDHYKTIFHGNHTGPYQAPFILITGGPGVGKSYLVNVFRGMSDRMKVGKQIRSAYFGIAAVNIGGSSLLALCNIPTDWKGNARETIIPWTAEKLKEFKRRYDVSKISAFIVDEVSTIKPYMIGYLNARLRVATGINKPFGGIAIVLLGDFDQLPPVGDDSIPTTIMKREKQRVESPRQYSNRRNPNQFTTVTGRGAELFKTAAHIRLTTQHRSEDEEHTKLLQRMSNGETIEPKDLRLYRALGPDDEDFRFATILTSGNRERYEFNELQSRKWAMHYGTNVVKWKRRINASKWRGMPRGDDQMARTMTESCFWELFVPGIHGYLTSNINTEISLANGSDIRYHSLSFANARDEASFHKKLIDASPGDEIVLDSPPDTINVELFPDLLGDDEKTRRRKAKLRRRWKHGSVTNDGRVVIPIRRSASKNANWKTEVVRGRGGYRCRPSKVQCADHFPLEPGFAVTLHKAQGRTIRRVILCLSKHPNHRLMLKWESLYVGLSRVRHRNDIRLLLRNGDWSTLEYISDLKKDKHIQWFFRGYPSPHPSSPQPVYWDRDLAVEAAGFGA